MVVLQNENMIFFFISGDESLFQPNFRLFNEDFFLINLFIYLFMAALGLCCCVRAFSSCGERRLLFVVVRRLLMAVASLVAEHGL